MFGKATLELPATHDSDRYETDGLSDRLALSLGRIAATTLSDKESRITVTLEDGTVLLIGLDRVSGKVVIGRES